ncbi:1-acyl-sn-glycerol-3-phosphate acyltransferase [Streptomyces sp. NPDC050504]|uniref:1-acyl-sn-glycerol-3-phosphate acyltransferase n=1 Tax=Streptomyces sp. NPDC050504 TaxID=3365618 RepID=UPI0037A997FE
MNPAEQSVPAVAVPQASAALVGSARGVRAGAPPRVLAAFRALSRATLFAVCLLLVLALSPVLLVLRIVAPGLPRPVRGAARLALLCTAYLLTCEVSTLFGALRPRLSRVRAGRGPSGARTPSQPSQPSRPSGPDGTGLAMVRRSTGAFFGPGLRSIGMPLHCPPPPDLDPARPVVVLLRHAGLLNMQLAVHLVVNVLRQRPHGVCKSAATWLPGAAAIVRETSVVPLRWNAEGRARAGRELVSMGHRLAAGDAVAVLPEGTNFSERRRRARIARLRRRGRPDLAAAAEAMPRVLPPVVRGTAALLAAAPRAQVLVVGHTGLEDVLPWRLAADYPPGRAAAVHLTWRSFGSHEVPREPDALEAWLYDRWRELDAWVLTTRTGQGARTAEESAAHP